MKHYSSKEWELYKRDDVSDEQSKIMEDHLLQCEQCLERFLSLIETKEIEKADAIVPEDFSETVMAQVEEIEYSRPTERKSKPKKRWNSMLTYYVAAASLTLVLMGSGFFETLVKTIPNTVDGVVRQERTIKVNAVMQWSERVVNRTSYFINNFEVSDKEDVR